MDEQERLKAATYDFSEVMLKRLIEKMNQGYHGWDELKNLGNVEEKLWNHLDRPLTAKNLVDIANLCMMLWRFDTVGLAHVRSSVAETLEANEGLCMDNEEERQKLCEDLVNRLKDVL